MRSLEPFFSDDGATSPLSSLLDDGFLLESLPIGMYVCDADGLILRYNRAAAELWGREPRLGEPEERFCGSYRLLDLDDAHIPHAECPMAVALATGQGMRDQHIQVERPDGSRVMALVNIEPLREQGGGIIGAVNVFRDSALRHPPSGIPGAGAPFFSRLLQALPAAVYTTDAAGRITFFNEAAAKMWGVRPEIGQGEFCGSWRLYRPDGSPLPHDQCPMAIALKGGRALNGEEAVAERPDGTRVPFLAYPAPLFGEDGELTGAVNMLVDISERKVAELASQRLAAIVESSDDAILSKDINGIITSWNRGAQRIFGYREDEVLGQPVTILIPADRQDEEPTILSRIRCGKRIEHYETVRQRKDGSLVDISLSVSPIFGPNGTVVGASKIARDISERRRAEEQKDLLLHEMDHRIKNLFALAGGLVNVCARGATSVQGLVSDLQGKFLALARAHSLTLAVDTVDSHRIASLHALIAEVAEPYRREEASEQQIVVAGPDFPLGRNAVTNIALLFHEFATNAVKYGALANPAGQVLVDCADLGDDICVIWREVGAGVRSGDGSREGFGSRLARATIAALGGRFERGFTSQGFEIRMTVPKVQLRK